MSDFQPFEMERYMSVHEMEVKYNMSESGVHPILRPFTVHIRQGVNNNSAAYCRD